MSDTKLERPLNSTNININTQCSNIGTSDQNSTEQVHLLKQLIHAIPKVELHLHLEGTLEPELVVQLAKRNCIDLSPHSKNEGDLRKLYEHFTGLNSFLEVYYQAASVLRTKRDFYDLAMAYFERAHHDNVVYAEVFFDPQCHKNDRGISFETCANGILAAMEDAHTNYGITSKLIVCFLRHLSEESAISTWNDVRDYIKTHPGSKSRIIGVGLDSSEIGNPPQKFRTVFQMIRNSAKIGEVGEMHIVAHAGEEGPPSYIVEALDGIHAERIDHGVQCLKDPALVHRLRMEHIPLTVCPLSNLRLQVFNRLEDHKLKQMLDLGLNVSIHSDDPAYFGGYINDNYRCVVDALNLDENDVMKLAKNAINSAFLTDRDKDILLRRLSLESKPFLHK